MSGLTTTSDGEGRAPGVLGELWALSLGDSVPQGSRQSFPGSVHLLEPQTRALPGS